VNLPSIILINNGYYLKNNKPKLSSEALLSVLDQQGCGIIAINAAGIITQMNARAEKLTGWSESEALQQDIGLVYGANFGNATKSSPLTQHILESSNASAPSAPIELTSLSGKKYMVNHAAMPLFDEQSQLTGVALSFRDITNSLELEEQLANSNNTLQSIIDNFPLPMGITNLNGQLTLVNEAFAELLGRSKESCLGQASAEVFPGENTILYKEQDQEVLQTAAPIKYMFSLFKSKNQLDGQKCTLTKFPLFDKNGETYSIGFICNKLIDMNLEKGLTTTQESVNVYEAGATATPDPLGTPPKIIVVDDDAQMRELTKEILEIAGFEVLCPKSAMHALELLDKESNSISLLITDIMMPELDGYQLAEKALEINPDLKILLASGFNSHLADENPLKALAQINKPYSSHQLLDLVSTLLDSN